MNTSLIITKDQKQQLDEHSKRLGLGISALVRLAIAEWLDRQAREN